MNKKILNLFKCTLFFVLAINKITLANKNLPLIAILSAPEDGSDKTSKNYLVNANYVRWLEANGMEAIAIHPWYTEAQLFTVLEKVNGVLIQGENVSFEANSTYINTVNSIANKLKTFETNPNLALPLLAINTGFVILQDVLAEAEVHSSFPALKAQSSLVFEQNELKDSKIFNNLSPQMANILKNTTSIYENHSVAVSADKYSNSNKLREFMNYIARDKDSNGNLYVAVAEGIKNYPFFGIQFHPEIISFNKIKDNNVPETFESGIVSRHFGHFLLKQASLNKNIFENMRADANYLTGKLTGPADKSGSYFYKFEKPAAN